MKHRLLLMIAFIVAVSIADIRHGFTNAEWYRWVSIMYLMGIWLAVEQLVTVQKND